MSIQSTRSFNTAQEVFFQRIESSKPGTPEAKTANNGQSTASDGLTVTLSNQSKSMQNSESVYWMSMGSGSKNVDLDSYFERQPEPLNIKDGLSNLLLPSMDNLAALQQHISSKFPGFLSRNGIAEAPDTIKFDDQGNLVLPEDYLYKEQLTQALNDNPAMLKELQTANALASHVAAIQATEPMREALAEAKNQIELDAIVKQYAAFFGDNRSQAYPDVSLKFSSNGALSIQADEHGLV